MSSAPAQAQRLEVLTAPEGYLVAFPNENQPLLDLDDAPLRDPGDGWLFSGVLTGIGPVSLLELRHETGGQATWYLNDRFAVIAHALAGLPDDARQQLAASMRSVIGACTDHVMAGAPLSVAPAVLDIAPDTLMQLMPPPSPDKPPVQLDRIAWGTIFAEPADDGRDVPIPAVRLSGLLGQTILDLSPAVVRGRRLSLPSPVDGVPVDSDFCLLLSHFVVAYRFLDPRHGVPFFLVATTHVCTIVAAYFPNSDTTYARDGWTVGFLLGHHPGAPVAGVIKQHVVRYLRPLLDYAAMSVRRPAFLYTHRHLGHHLWQDLGGLDTLLTGTDVTAMPELIMLNARASEMWGRLDVLFPILAGKIDRTLVTEEQLTLHVYRTGLCVFMPTGSRISPSLTDRIVEVACSADATAPDRAILSRLRSGDRVPIVLLGLRVENRTVVDFPAFIASVIEMLRDECSDRVAIVIDGHSADDGVVFESHNQGVIHAEPLLVERAIADAAIASVAAGSDTTIIDTIGAAMARSLFWSRHADFFITPWGAGLAKYRWIGDRPGLVLAGQLFQSSAADLHIYDDRKHGRAAVTSRIIDPRFVQDVPDDPCIVPISEPIRTNYRVDLAAVRDEVRILFSMVGS